MFTWQTEPTVSMAHFFKAFRHTVFCTCGIPVKVAEGRNLRERLLLQDGKTKVRVRHSQTLQ